MGSNIHLKGVQLNAGWSFRHSRLDSSNHEGEIIMDVRQFRRPLRRKFIRTPRTKVVGLESITSGRYRVFTSKGIKLDFYVQ